MNASIKKILLIAIILPLTACFPPPFYPGVGYYHGYRANQPGYYNNAPYYGGDRFRHEGYHDGWHGHHHGHH